MPSVLKAADKLFLGKRCHDFHPAVERRLFLKLAEKASRRLIKISLRHGRISFSFAVEESFDISAILFEQRLHPIFRMPLKVHKQTFALFLHEYVYARIRRLGENDIAGGNQFIFPYFIPPRMGKADTLGGTVHECVIVRFPGLEDAELLVGQAVTLDTVAIKNAGMRRQAGEHG